MSSSPRSKSVQRAAASALSKDEKARANKKTSTVDSFVNFANNLGIGADNQLSSSSYGFNPVTRNRTMLEWIHRGSWLGGVAVDVVADDMTRAGITIKGDIKPADISKLEEDAVDLDIWNNLNDTIKWSRLYGGALAVLLIDGQDISTPLRLNTIRKDQFRGLLSLDRWMVEPSLQDLITDMGPHMGMPKFYRVTSQAPGLNGAKIHHSRVIRLAGIKLPYWQRLMENMWGLSVLERLYDRMIAFDSASTGAAQLVYKSYIRTYKIKDMREIIAAGGDAVVGLTSYVDMMRRFQGIEGITLMDGEDDFEGATHGAFGGLSDAIAQFGQQLSGALGIPLVRLFGQSPMGFSTGETDLRNYYDTIKQQQEKELRTGVTKVIRCMAASSGVNFPEGCRIEFNSLWQMDDKTKSEVASNTANAVSSAEGTGIISRAVALKELKQVGTVTGIFTNITEEMIKEAEMEPPPLPEGMGEEGENPQQGVKTSGQGGETAEPGGKVTPGTEGAKNSDSTRRTKDQAFAAGLMFTGINGNVLLVRRAQNQTLPGTWGLPAGHVEAGESSKQTAIREAHEEVGFLYSGSLVPMTTYPGFAAFVAPVAEEFLPKLNEELDGYAWVKQSDIAHGLYKNEPLHPGMEELLNALWAE